MTKAEVGEIEPLCVSCQYDGHTIFSIFAEQGEIYEAIYDQIRANEGQSERKMMNSAEFELYMRRMRYVITRPTPVLDNKD